jgi:hypothetical protein
MYATGAKPSPYDIRTFAYVPSGIPVSGGTRYTPKDIEHQHKVGICTAISTTQNARKALGKKFSSEFQYLMQKKKEKNFIKVLEKYIVRISRTIFIFLIKG